MPAKSTFSIRGAVCRSSSFGSVLSAALGTVSNSDGRSKAGILIEENRVIKKVIRLSIAKQPISEILNVMTQKRYRLEDFEQKNG